MGREGQRDPLPGTRQRLTGSAGTRVVGQPGAYPCGVHGGITLDRDREPWLGTFPGLGRVEVHADGAISATAEPGQESIDLRNNALRYGWGEPLSWVRRGYALLHGGCVTPDPAVGAILLTGDLHEFGRLLPAMTGAGWVIGSDRYTPTRWSGDDLVAEPTRAPILLSQRRLAAADWTGKPVRGDTDTCAVEVTRTSSPLPIRAVVDLTRARPDDEPFSVLTGHQRFELAASLRLGGAMRPSATDDKEAAELSEHLRLARLRIARVRVSGDRDDLPQHVAAVEEWFRGDST